MQTRIDPLKPATETPTVQAPAPAPAAAPGGLKRVSLGGIAKKKDDTASKYPTYPDADGKAAELAARIAQRQDQNDALEAALEVDKAELARVLVRPWYLRHFHGKTDVPSSVLVDYTAASAGSQEAPTKRSLRVTVMEKYYAFPNEDAFIPILGDDTQKYFRQSFEIKIKGDKLPAEHAATIIERLQVLFGEFDCADALEAKEAVTPVPNFKALRFTRMPLEQSLALETVGEKGLTWVSVGTKNVRK